MGDEGSYEDKAQGHGFLQIFLLYPSMDSRGLMRDLLYDTASEIQISAVGVTIARGRRALFLSTTILL